MLDVLILAEQKLTSKSLYHRGPTTGAGDTISTSTYSRERTTGDLDGDFVGGLDGDFDGVIDGEFVGDLEGGLEGDLDGNPDG